MTRRTLVSSAFAASLGHAFASAQDHAGALPLSARWRKEGGPTYNGITSGIWLRAARIEDALIFARGLPAARERSEQLCATARQLLDNAGAPFI